MYFWKKQLWRLHRENMSTNPSFVVSCNAILKPSKWAMETCHINDPFHLCLDVFLFTEGCRTKTRRGFGDKPLPLSCASAITRQGVYCQDLVQAWQEEITNILAGKGKVWTRSRSWMKLKTEITLIKPEVVGWGPQMPTDSVEHLLTQHRKREIAHNRWAWLQ